RSPTDRERVTAGSPGRGKRPGVLVRRPLGRCVVGAGVPPASSGRGAGATAPPRGNQSTEAGRGPHSPALPPTTRDELQATDAESMWIRPPLAKGGLGGEFPAQVHEIARPKNPPVSPLRKGGMFGKPCSRQV